MEAVPQSDPNEEQLTTTEDSQPDSANQNGCCSCSPQRLVCISHALSAWGDRMWEFAVALYLVELTPGSLRLTAVFQLVRTLVTIFLGPNVGNWVDGNPRLRVAQISLLVQNIAVAASALLLLLILSVHLSKGLFFVLVSLVIIVACLSVLAGIATKISIEKDWIVVICGGDKGILAGANAVLRRIDLVCKILAPVLVGQIMTYVSKQAGVILIAAWNIVSVFFEYYMLIRVFRAVPSLAIKKIDKKRHEDATQSSSAEQTQGSRDRLEWMERENENVDIAEDDAESLVPRTVIGEHKARRKPSLFQSIKNHLVTMKVGCQIYFRQTVALPGLSLACLYFTVLSFGSITTGYIYTQNISESILSILRGAGSLLGILATFVFPRMRNSLGLVRSGLFSMSAQFTCMLFCLIAIFAPGSPFFLLPDSWRYHGSTIITHNVHNITEGNCSLSSPILVLPPRYDFHENLNQLQAINGTSYSSNIFLYTTPSLYSSSSPFIATLTPSLKITTSPLTSTARVIKSSLAPRPSSTLVPSPSPTSIAPLPPSPSPYTPSPSIPPRTLNCTVDEVKKKSVSHNFSYISIVLLIAGIVLSRFGLWLSDLCITQLQQENVPEEERGIVGGMQKAYNSLLDMAMYVFVIALPKAEEFGIMGVMSVSAVGIGGVLYARFAYKSRGHLFHFDKIKRALVRVGSRNRQTAQQRSPSRENLINNEDEEEDEMLIEVLTTRNENFTR